jgi:hypothetical protein
MRIAKHAHTVPITPATLCLFLQHQRFLSAYNVKIPEESCKEKYQTASSYHAKYIILVYLCLSLIMVVMLPNYVKACVLPHASSTYNMYKDNKYTCDVRRQHAKGGDRDGIDSLSYIS